MHHAQTAYKYSLLQPEYNVCSSACFLHFKLVCTTKFIVAHLNRKCSRTPRKFEPPSPCYISFLSLKKSSPDWHLFFSPIFFMAKTFLCPSRFFFQEKCQSKFWYLVQYVRYCPNFSPKHSNVKKVLTLCQRYQCIEL